MSSTSRARRLVANLTIIGLAPAILAPPALAAGATTKRVSVRTGGAEARKGDSDQPVISANGRYVAFGSAATNLVRGDTHGEQDVFVHDRRLKRTRRVSVRNAGGQSNGSNSDPAVSANGRFVAFESDAGNLVARDRNGHFDVFVRGPLR